MHPNLQRRSARGIPGQGRLREISLWNRSVILLLTICVGPLVGCSKEEASSPGANPAAPASAAKPAQSGSASGPAAAQPAPKFITAHAQNEPAQNVAGEVHPFLTEQLQIFVQQKGRMPQSFAELAGVRLDSIPSAPPGKKWVIDTASAQVKAVNAP
jgi:hypothetical protein